HAVENILEAAAKAPACAGAKRMGLEAATSCPRIAAGESLKARLALGIDLAAIKLLALVDIANNLIGRIQLGKTSGGLRIVLVGVGVIFLGKLAIGALDRRSRGAPRHPQDLIGVAHPSNLLQGKA